MRLSPPSLGSSVKIEAGTLAFGNDKNLWLRKKRNDKNTYWSSFAELNLELGMPRNVEATYNYLQIKWEIPDFGIFNLTYNNSGNIMFQSFSNNNDELLFLNVPLIRASSNKRRIDAFKDIIFDFINDLRLRPDIDLQLITTMSQELNKLFNVLLNGFYDISENYLDKNDNDFQASIDFPLKRTFRPNSDDLFILDITNAEQEPTPTPQPETPEAEKGLPSTDPETWNGEFKVGDKVKVRWDFSNDLGLEETKGFSKVDYFSSENNYSVVNVIISSDSMRPENITGKLYELNTGQFWEGKDLELFTENDQPEQIDNDDLENGKLFYKSTGNVNTFLKIDSETDILRMYTNGWEFIKPTYWSNESFLISSTKKLIDLSIAIDIELNYETGIFIYYSNIKTQEVISKKNITNPTEFTSVIDEIIEKVGRDSVLSLELRNIKKIYNKDIWISRKIKCAFVEQESTPTIGKLLTKEDEDNLGTYLKISEDVIMLVLNSDKFQFIQPVKFNNSKIFKFLSTGKANEQYDTICKIRLDYELGIDINFFIPSRDIDYKIVNITSEITFLNAIAYVKKFLLSGQFEQELDLIALLLQQGIWIKRSIKCDFVSGIPKPKFQVGDKVTKINNKKRIFTITSITTFDNNEQQWDYDVVEDIDGNKLSYWENQLELVSTEIPTTSKCDVDLSLIDSQYVGQFYQQNKNRIEALNPNISCLFLEALLSLSNYEKCGDGVEIPMPQPKKEEKEDLLSQIRNL